MSYLYGDAYNQIKKKSEQSSQVDGEGHCKEFWDENGRII